MKTLKFALILFSFIGLFYIGCSEELQSPVSPSDQTSLQKNVTREFTGRNEPTHVTINDAIYKFPDDKIMVLKHKGETYFEASFEDNGPDILSGPGEIEISGMNDLTTMQGQWRGKLVLMPNEASDGLWQFTWHGPSVYSPTAYENENGVFPGLILSLQMVGHGEGGDIHGMQIRADVTVHCLLDFSDWYGDFTGVITSH